MGSIFLSDFKFGMDRRRPRIAGTPGTLWTGENVVITRGGDIERAKRFVLKYFLPTGQTFGLAELRGQIWTFGSLPAPPLPLGVDYQQLVAPSGASMTGVLDARAAAGKLYVIASFADGNTFHFYDGVRVTDWDTVADGGFTFNVLADYFATLINSSGSVTAAALNNFVILTAAVPGTPFTVSRSTLNYGVISDQDIVLTTIQANVPAVAEVRASTVVTIAGGTSGVISSLKINGAELLWSSVTLTTGTLSDLATSLAQSINNNSLASNYFATATVNAVTITAKLGQGATPNGFAVVSVASGDLVVTAPAMSGGVDPAAGTAQVVSAKIIGTQEGADLYVLTINGVDYKVVGRAASTGNSIFVSTRRVFSTAGSLIVWCALANLSPAAWSIATTYNLASTVLGSDSNIYSSLADGNTGHNPVGDGGVHWSLLGASTRAPQTIWIPYTDPNNAPIGPGNINVSNDAEGSERLIGLGVYLLNQMAAFTRRNIRIYNLSTDATQIGLVQPVDNTGALAARSILAFGSTDTFYLADSGIRSLRPRQTTNTAYMDDIGTAIDPFVRDQLDSLTNAQYGRAVTVMEPRDDRFWMAVDSRVYVLSYFPTSQISAWSYLAPGFVISDFARVFDKLYARSGDTIYLYGGDTGTEYPAAGEFVAEVELPFAADTPPGRSILGGFDMAAQGEWSVFALVSPDNEDARVNIGMVDGNTYGEADINVPGVATHLAVNMTCSAAGYASISNINLHTDAKEAEG